VRTIKLARGEWKYDPTKQLGPAGGFGVVYEGLGDACGEVAVKELKIDANQAAHRELRLANEIIDESHEHIIPIYDAGQDAESDRYYIIMAKADYSLQDLLNSCNNNLKTDCLNILCEIILGLKEVSAIVHRDIKPGNILFHDNRWKISDFGIARFVEESTSLRTLKECLSPLYAAPEQWQLEKVSHSTDVYALGCIAYALLTGKPPFCGQTSEELKKQHLHADPPNITDLAPLFQSALSMMLRKVPASRPSLDRLLQIFKKISAENPKDQQQGLAAIAIAGAAAAEQAAKAESERLAKEAVTMQRRELSISAYKILGEILSNLLTEIQSNAPTATIEKRASQYQIYLGGGKFIVNFLNVGDAFPVGLFSKTGWDVITSAAIRVDQSSPPYVWSASLWYASLNSGESYRWYETAYFGNAFYRNSGTYSPISLERPGDADLAHCRTTMGPFCVAYEPIPIDDENVESFYNRWANLLAKAFKGSLCYPSHQPFDPDKL